MYLILIFDLTIRICNNQISNGYLCPFYIWIRHIFSNWKKSRYLEDCSKSVADPRWSVVKEYQNPLHPWTHACNVCIWSMCTKIMTKITRSNLDVSIIQINKTLGLWFLPFLLVSIWWSWLFVLLKVQCISLHLHTFSISVAYKKWTSSVWFSSFMNGAI